MLDQDHVIYSLYVFHEKFFEFVNIKCIKHSNEMLHII